MELAFPRTIHGSTWLLHVALAFKKYSLFCNSRSHWPGPLQLILTLNSNYISPPLNPDVAEQLLQSQQAAGHTDAEPQWYLAGLKPM